MQMAGQVECKQVVKWDANAWSSQVQFPRVEHLGQFSIGRTASTGAVFGQRQQAYPHQELFAGLAARLKPD